jgi:hypothetical protein
MDFTVVNHVSELGEYCCTTSILVGTLLFAYLPNADFSVITPTNEELCIIPKCACDARYRVRMSFLLLASKQDRAVYLHVPESDRAILVTTCYQTTFVEECNAREL